MDDFDALVEDTKTLLRVHLQSARLEQVAAGAEVGVHWLSKFHQGRIKNPTIKNVGRIRRFLTQQAA